MRALRGLSALIATIGLVVCVPIGLARVGRLDALTEVDWRHLLTTPDTGALLLGLLTVAAWLAWATFILSLMSELARVATGGRVAWRLPGTGWARPLTAALVVALAALVTPGGAVAHAETDAVSAAGRVATPVASPAVDPVGRSEPFEERGRAASPTRAHSRADATVAVHVVVQGDDLWTIAEHHYGDGSRWRSIAAANGLGADSVLHPGDRLALPGLPGAKPDENPEPAGEGESSRAATVTVRAGDSLSALAARHLGDADRWPEIASANPGLVDDPDVIEPGWVLRLPAPAAEPSAPAAERTKADNLAVEETPAPQEATPAPATAQSSPQAPTAGASAPEPPSEATPTAQHSEQADDGDRLELLGSMGGLLAVALVAAVAMRREGQLAVRGLGRRIVPADETAQLLEAALRRRASEVTEAEPAWTPTTIVVGLDSADDPVLVDLEAAGTTVLTSSEPGAESAAETTLGALAAALTSLVSASWSADTEVILSAPELAWVGSLDNPRLTQHQGVEAGVVALERLAAERRVQLGRQQLARLRESVDVAEAWQPVVHLFGEAPTPEQWRRIRHALRRDASTPSGVGISVLAVADHRALPECGEALELTPERGRLCSSGATFVPQLIARPARRALMSLFEATASEQTVPAPWWSHETDRPANLCVLEPRPQGADEEVVVSAETHAHPTLLLLGPVVLAGARGPEPSRARGQCAEYCAWIHFNPGRTASGMNRELMVADSTRRSNLSRLRAWLGTDDEGRPYLPEAYTGRITLHAAVSSDWERIGLLLAAGVNRSTDDALVDVLKLVRGAPLGDAAPGTWGWAESLRVDMVSTIRDVGVVLTRRAIEAGELDLARWAASRALAAAPEDELLMCERIRTEHLAGNRSEVERLVLHLSRSARNLGVDLAEETVELMQEVMEGRRRALSA